MSQLDDETAVRRAAFKYFAHDGLNCAESVMKAVLEHNGKTCSPELLCASSAFGAGMGGSGCLCGALAGGVIALGILLGREGKALSKLLHEDFKREHGSTCCRILSRNLISGTTEKFAACAQRTASTAGLAAVVIRRENRERAKRKDLIAQILDAEWKMFARIRCPEGANHCAADHTSFQQARTSQFLTWRTDMLSSYLADLEAAREAGRNLLEEKYARMMEVTHPYEFAKFSHLLPKISLENWRFITKILEVHREWMAAFENDYPHVAMHSQPGAEQPSQGVTSSDTYLCGELQTYSLDTLRLYYDHIAECRAAERNLAKENFTRMVNCYGFHTLEEAESSIDSMKASHANPALLFRRGAVK